MARRQTRRSISTSGRMWARLKRYCAGTDMSVAGFVETTMNRILDDLGEPEFEHEDIPAVTPRVTTDEPASGHWSF